MTASTLEIRDLSVSYSTPRGRLKALRNVDFKVPEGSITGIVGESGCGKSTLISAVIRLLAPNAQVDSGKVLLGGENLLALTEGQMQDYRGKRISTVFQDPMTSLNPVLTIGRQLQDIQHRSKAGKEEKRKISMEMLARVGIPDVEQQLNRYPHHLSGGMKQRVAIAMALMTEPGLLIADEPTTALDATLEVQIINRLQELQSEFGCSILFISHHLGVIAELCDQVVVMYAGEVVESGSTRDIFHRPTHPYTRRLLECDPARIRHRADKLPVIEGTLPDLVELPSGCVFSNRCTETIDRCHTTHPKLGGINHRTACHLAGKIT
jgi:oligopeptide/dipeptide ABC transporter ATP-binding protein